MFEKEIYISRREKLKQQVGTGVLLFLGNAESPMNYKDNTYHFRQDSTFLYYFGINEPNLAAVIDLDNNETTIFGNELSMDDIIWMGRKKTIQEKALAVGVALLLPFQDLHQLLKIQQEKGRNVHYLPPYRTENLILLAQLLALPLAQVESQVSITLIKAVVEQRSIKSAEEIEELDLASSISADIHLLVMKMAKSGMYEREIAAKIQEHALANGGNLAYPAIVTVEGQILHNHYYGNQLKNGDLLLNDSGVETAMGYAGDLTRTFPVSARFSAQQAELYDVVYDAFAHARNLLMPGKRFINIHFEACKKLVSGLKDVGLMKGNVDDAVAEGAHAMFFQCGLGHMMGLDVHDMEDLGEQYVGYNDQIKKETQLFGLKSLRLGKELREGFVLTVEPGIYIIPELIDQWKAAHKFTEFIDYHRLESYRNFSGVRMEDDFLITANGFKKLGKPLAITRNDVEEIRREALEG